MMNESHRTTPTKAAHQNEKIDLSDATIRSLTIAQLHTLEQVKELVTSMRAASSKEPITSEAIWNLILQVLGLIAAGLFGIFSILDWKEGQESNNMGTRANWQTSRQNCMAGAANLLSIQEFCEKNSTIAGCRFVLANPPTNLGSLYDLATRHAGVCASEDRTSQNDQPPDYSKDGVALSRKQLAGLISGLAILLMVIASMASSLIYKAQLKRIQSRSNGLPYQKIEG